MSPANEYLMPPHDVPAAVPPVRLAIHGSPRDVPAPVPVHVPTSVALRSPVPSGIDPPRGSAVPPTAVPPPPPGATTSSDRQAAQQQPVPPSQPLSANLRYDPDDVGNIPDYDFLLASPSPPRPSNVSLSQRLPSERRPAEDAVDQEFEDLRSSMAAFRQQQLDLEAFMERLQRSHRRQREVKTAAEPVNLAPPPESGRSTPPRRVNPPPDIYAGGSRYPDRAADT